MIYHNGGALHANWIELSRYLKENMHWNWCNSDDRKGDEDARRFASNDEFMAQTDVFMYQNIGLMIQGIHRPYFAQILEMTADRSNATLIDVGAGGGQIGLAFHELGFHVSWADIEGRSIAWLMWRLARRHIDRPVFILDARTVPLIPRHDIAVCFDVLEHLDLNAQLDLLDNLARWADVVFVNLIRDDRPETQGIHTSVDFERVGAYVHSKWNGVERDYYPDAQGKPRQRLLIYGEGVRQRNG